MTFEEKNGVDRLERAMKLVDYIGETFENGPQQTLQIALVNAVIAAVEQLVAINEKFTPAPMADNCTACGKSFQVLEENALDTFSGICNICKKHNENLVLIMGIAVCPDCVNR